MSKKEVLSFDPNHLSQQGIKYLNEGNFDKSKEIFSQLIIHFPDNTDLLNLLGFVNLQLHSYDESYEAYTKSIEINPNQVEVFFNRAIVGTALKKLNDAIKDYAVVLSHNPKNMDALINQSVAYQDIQNYEEGLKLVNIALSYNPNNFKALSNRGNLYQNLFRYKEAIVDFELAIQLEPGILETYVNKGNSLKFIGKLTEAAEAFEEALAIDKNNASAQFHYSILLLSQKKFTDGWKKYKFRKELKFFNPPTFTSNIKNCMNLDNKNSSFVLWGEQGVGDQIIYASMLGNLKEYKNITIALDARLIDLFSRSFEGIKFITFEDVNNLSKIDYQMPFADLGYFYRNELSDFRNNIKPFLFSDKKKMAEYKKKISKKDKLICGISWKSHNKTIGHSKSITLKDLVPILECDNLSFVDLQYGDTSEERSTLKDKNNINIQKLASVDNYNDLDSLAALIDACDIVLTVSNVTAHLAGALGKKTYLMVPCGVGSMWYWHRDDHQSLWYPSVEMFRQDEPQGWSGVIGDILRKIQTRNTVN